MGTSGRDHGTCNDVARSAPLVTSTVHGRQQQADADVQATLPSTRTVLPQGA